MVLAIVTAGFRDLLAARGVDPDHRRIRALLPLTAGGGAERVAGMLADLPVRAPDPVAMHAAVVADGVGRRGMVDASAMARLAGFAPPALLSLGVRAASRAAALVDEVAIDTVVASAPGPTTSRHACGRLVFHAFAHVPLTAPVRVAIATTTYDGELTVGITVDPDAVGDVADLVAGIEAGLLELRHAAERT